ncbi:MAG TPA: hypothetical protein VE734_08755 [Terriglobales bacterium]|nr:hypothetical protein [Terriglobales bacterium]
MARIFAQDFWGFSNHFFGGPESARLELALHKFFLLGREFDIHELDPVTT